jgi:hypothetical protein
MQDDGNQQHDDWTGTSRTTERPMSRTLDRRRRGGLAIGQDQTAEIERRRTEAAR